MSVAESLEPRELARQLSNPEGEVGLAVMRWVDDNNRRADAAVIESLGLAAGDRVLEIGFGTGRMAPAIVSRATNVRYAGLDTSSAMVGHATHTHARLVAAGQVGFHLGSAEQVPFSDESFDKVFSVGVVHFWASPVRGLKEIRRVLRRGGLSLAGCLHPRTRPAFARPEYGFDLRDAAEWEAVHRAAGFSDIGVETVESKQLAPDGTPTQRYVFKLTAHA